MLAAEKISGRLMMSFPRMGWATGLVAIALLSGCAHSVPTEPTRLNAAIEQPAKVIRLEREALIVLPTGYKRQLQTDSKWRLVGSIAQGQVFRPVNSVLTIEGRQVHEAYLVISSGVLRGFYLPGESNYAPLQAPVPLSIGEIS
jgi:hypothetical protein